MKTEQLLKKDQLAKPFIKWAGGKRALIPELMQRLPERFNDYYEPFLGGGALFYEARRSHIHQKAYLFDVNAELITAYQVVMDDPHDLIEALKEHAAKHDKEHYYAVRSNQFPNNPVEIAARFIYLNKTCFNGLYRVNAKGMFNTPIGSQKKMNIADEETILACSRAFQENCVFRCASYEAAVPKKEDFVYLDPPYHPVNDGSFTSYTKNGFTEEDQVKLAQFFRKSAESGAYVMESNSDTPFIRELYKEFNIQIVEAPRRVNSKSSGRGNVTELVISNY